MSVKYSDMKPSRQADTKAPDEVAQQAKVAIAFTKLPEGIIHFCAPPKVWRKADRSKPQKFPRKSRPRRILQKNADVDSVIDLLQSLDVARGTDGSTAIPKPAQSCISRPRQIVKLQPSEDSRCRKIMIARRTLRKTKSDQLKNANRIAGTDKPAKKVAPSPALPEAWTKPKFVAKIFPKTTPADPKLLFKDTTTYAFTAHRGLWRCEYAPTDTTLAAMPDSTSKTYRVQSISMMQRYECKSFEEIRFEDYVAGWNKGAPYNQGSKFEVSKDTDQFVRLGAGAVVIETKHHVMTASPEYSGYSLDELRLEHYMPGIAWKDSLSLSLSRKEMKKLPVRVGSRVLVYVDGSANQKKAVIRFIGRLPTKPQKEIWTGVELDEACGSSDGHFKGRRLFRTKPSRAEFVLIDSVLPLYMMEESDIERNAQSTSQATSSPEKDSTKGVNCAVCWGSPIQMIFLPCGHVCACAECAKKLADCPVCRKKILTKRRAYISGS